MAKSKLQKNKDNPRSKYWKTRADKLWGYAIHSIYDTCIIDDDCSGRIEAHHLIGRARTATRHKIENGVGLCTLHHKFSNTLSAHAAPLAFAERLREELPSTWEWCSENKYKVSKPDYAQSYSDLIDFCVENGISVSEF